LVLPKVLWFCVFRSKLNSAWVLNPTMIVRKGWNEKRGQLSVLLSFGKKNEDTERRERVLHIHFPDTQNKVLCSIAIAHSNQTLQVQNKNETISG